MDSLEIEGKEYISARRAGKEHGYTSDYIGQLIRKGSLEGKKVGRAWYVSVDSLSAYEKVLEEEKESRSVQMKEEVAKYAAEPTKVIVHPKLENPYKSLPVRPAHIEKNVPGVSIQDVDAVFGMRYMSDEESTLPVLSVRKESTKEEVVLPIRTMERDFAVHSARNDGFEEEYASRARVRKQSAHRGRFLGVLQATASIAVILILIGATAGVVFMEKTILFNAESAVASVSVSWMK